MVSIQNKLRFYTQQKVDGNRRIECTRNNVRIINDMYKDRIKYSHFTEQEKLI